MLLPRMTSSGLGPLEELREAVDVDAVRVVFPHREVEDRGRLGRRVAGDEVAQRAHRLGAQVPALDDVVVGHRADAPRLGAPVVAVEVVDEGAEDGRVGHLPADHPRLDLAGPEELAHLLDQVALDPGDEIGALVVVDVGVQERPHPLVLGVAKCGVRDRERPHQRRLGHLRRDEVDAPVLAPAAVVERPTDQVGRPGGMLGDRRDLGRPRGGQFAEGDRTAERRRIRADQPGRHPGPDAVAADVHLDLGVILHVDVQEGHPDGPLLAPLGEDARQALAGEDPVGRHGPAGHVPDQAVARVHLGTLPCHAAVEELERA